MTPGDWGQYTEEQVFEVLKPRKGSGVCERCGKKTKTSTIFGRTICKDCWDKQTLRGKYDWRKKKV